MTTDARTLYLDGDKPARYLARGATLVRVGHAALREANARGDAESPGR